MRSNLTYHHRQKSQKEKVAIMKDCLIKITALLRYKYWNALKAILEKIRPANLSIRLYFIV